MILYAGFHIGGSVGPLPYDMPECQDRAVVMNEQLAKSRKQPATLAKMKKLQLTVPLKNWRFVCEARATRPKLKSL